MSIFQKFEDIIAWQKARVLCQVIKKYTDKELFSKDFKLVSQIKASSGSAMDNIAEGFERGGNKEFIQFLFISKGSAGETRSQLYRALDNEYINKEEFQKAYDLADEVGKLIRGLINHLKESELKEINLKVNKNRLMRNVIMSITTLNTELKTQNYIRYESVE